MQKNTKIGRKNNHIRNSDVSTLNEYFAMKLPYSYLNSNPIFKPDEKEIGKLLLAIENP